MYDKKYVIESIEEFGKHNEIYDGVKGCICYPAYLKIGERGWFLYEPSMFDFAPVHRIHTSEIKSVDYIDDKVIVETQNTRFVFKTVAECV